MSFFKRLIEFLRKIFGLVSKGIELDEQMIADLIEQPANDERLRKVIRFLNRFESEAMEEWVKFLLKREKDKEVTGTHKRWENQIANQIVEPLEYLKPSNLGAVYDILIRADKNKLGVRAAGSGHSYSDVATTPDLFIDTHSLNAVASESSPIAGQLRQEDIKPEWQAATMKAKWKPMPDVPPVEVDSSMDDIMAVREVAENNTLLVETESGIKLRDLNKKLNAMDLGLPNMGGYDGQTLIGAISTSTHGSGIDLGPFPEMIRSIVIATTGKWNGTVISGSSSGPVNFYRIERTNGITDPDKYKQNQSQYRNSGLDIQLIQDDDCFEAVMVTMGTMGVIYSVVVEVMQFYYMTETREKFPMDHVMKSLEPDPNDPKKIPAILRRYRNYGLMVSPYPMDGNDVIDMAPGTPTSDYYKHIESTDYKRNITQPPINGESEDKEDKPRNPINAILGQFELSFKILVVILNLVPKLAPRIIKGSLNGMTDRNYVRKYQDIYTTGISGKAGFAMEIGFPVQDKDGNYTDVHLKAALDRIFEVAQTARLEGDQFQTSPFAIRFVKSSKANMSMMNGVDTVMLELDMVAGSYAGQEVVNRIQHHLYDLGGRPHWGLEFDQLTGNNDLLTQMYPEYPKWKKVYDQFNAKGTFNNATTNRLGLSKTGYHRSSGGDNLA